MSYPFTLDHLNKMQEGLELFNAQKYWECHEALEEIWMEDANDPVRNVYWAVIQVAASLIHYRDGKIVGARGLNLKAKEKFKRVHDMNIENELLYKSLDWLHFKALTFKVSDDPKLEEFSELYAWRFQNYKDYLK